MKDRFGLEPQVGDVIIVSSASTMRIARVYKISPSGRPLSEWIAGGWPCTKGFLGYDFIVIRRNGEWMPEFAGWAMEGDPDGS